MTQREQFNKVNRHGTNKLIDAIEKLDFNLVDEMIGKGADVNFKTEQRNFLSSMTTHVPYPPQSTPLHAACLLGAANIVGLLMENDADINVKNIEGQTPLDSALLSLSYFNAELTKKGASRFATQKGVQKTEDRIYAYESIVYTLLKAGAKTGVFALPEKFKSPEFLAAPPAAAERAPSKKNAPKPSGFF